jgi:translation elongation factor P/translation initiation factor 5A
MENSHLCPPISAVDIKKDQIVLLKGHPCKILEVKKSKTGKHGHIKCVFKGVCLISGKKIEDDQPGHVTMNSAIVEKREYMVIGVHDEIIDCLDDETNVVNIDCNNSEKGIEIYNILNSKPFLLSERQVTIEVMKAPIMVNNEIVGEAIVNNWKIN